MLSQKGLPESGTYFFCANLRGTTFDVVNVTVEHFGEPNMLAEITVQSRKCDIDPYQVIGNTATLNITQNQEILPYGGIVTNMIHEGCTDGITTYKIILQIRGWMMCA